MDITVIGVFVLALVVYVLAAYLKHKARWSAHQRLGEEWPDSTSIYQREMNDQQVRANQDSFEAVSPPASQVRSRQAETGQSDREMAKESILANAEGKEGAWGDEGREEDHAKRRSNVASIEADETHMVARYVIADQVRSGIVWAEILSSPGGHRISARRRQR